MYYFLAAAVIILLIILAVHFYWSKPYQKEEQVFTKGNGKSIRVGIVSDSQLPAEGKPSKWTERLEKSLELVKKNHADVLIFAGDFTDAGTGKAWKSFRDAYRKVFAASEIVPVFIMGNHDYWLPVVYKCFEIATPAKMQKRFMKYTGEKVFSHKTVNGYHFIAWSSENGSYDKSYTNTDWARREIEKAIKQSPDKPVFVITHLNPENSVYGSDEWGNADIYSVLKDYPQVISFSGHSHYSLLDERSIYQGDFTAINTQTIDYVELESGKFNGSVPCDAYGESIAGETPSVMMLYADAEQVTIDRLDALTGEKLKYSWNIKMPCDKNNFEYTAEKRKAANKTPYFEADASGKIYETVSSQGKKITNVVFDSAKDDDFVHSYAIEYYSGNGEKLKYEKTDYDGHVIIVNGKSQLIDRTLYFSSFVLGLDKMPVKEELRLTGNIPAETEYLKIYAIDSWGKESQPLEISVNANAKP